MPSRSRSSWARRSSAVGRRRRRLGSCATRPRAPVSTLSSTPRLRTRPRCCGIYATHGSRRLRRAAPTGPTSTRPALYENQRSLASSAGPLYAVIARSVEPLDECELGLPEKLVERSEVLLRRRRFEADEDARNKLPHEPAVFGPPEVEQRIAELRLRGLVEIPREEDGVRGNRPLLFDDLRAGKHLAEQPFGDVPGNDRDIGLLRLQRLPPLGVTAGEADVSEEPLRVGLLPWLPRHETELDEPGKRRDITGR